VKGTIKGVYTHSKDGEEYVTKNGNIFLKLLIALENGDSIYEAIFFTPKAHWKVEEVFASVGRIAPNPSELLTSHFNELVGSEIDVSVGQNTAGYDCVKKFYPAKNNKVEEALVSVPSEVDEDLDEDVPF
jgi:hypothetical protein